MAIENGEFIPYLRLSKSRWQQKGHSAWKITETTMKTIRNHKSHSWEPKHCGSSVVCISKCHMKLRCPWETMLGFLSESDRPIGAISVAKDRALSGKPEDDLFYIGSFFVNEKFRGIGVGKKLFNMAIECTKGSNVCLNAGMASLFLSSAFLLIFWRKNIFSSWSQHGILWEEVRVHLLFWNLSDKSSIGYEKNASKWRHWL